MVVFIDVNEVEVVVVGGTIGVGGSILIPICGRARPIFVVGGGAILLPVLPKLVTIEGGTTGGAVGVLTGEPSLEPSGSTEME